MDELQQLAKLEQDYQTKRTALLEAAKQQWLDQINPMIEIGRSLGFNYGPLDDKPSATPAANAAKSTESRSQLTDKDVRELQGHFLSYLKGNKGKPLTATEIFKGLDFTESRFQTYTKHLKALVESSHIEATVKDTSKGKSPKNPTAYLWVKDLDD